MSIQRLLTAAAALALIGALAYFFTRPGPRAEPAADEAGGAVERIWSVEFPERGAVVTTPAIWDDRVAVGAIEDYGFRGLGAVRCLDRMTGGQLWRFDAGRSMLHMYSSPCVAGGRLYIGEGMHANNVCKLYCLDPASGRELWHFTVDGHIESTPCESGGKVVFGAGDDGVYCLDAADGQKLWQFRRAIHVDTTPAIADGFVYVGVGVSRAFHEPQMICLHLGDGSPAWQVPADLPAWGSPAIENGRAYFGLGNGRLTKSAEPPEVPGGAIVCVEAATGNRLWRRDFPDAVLSRPWVGDGTVVAGCRSGDLSCLSSVDGTELWSHHFSSPIVTGVAGCRGRLYVIPTEGPITVLDAHSGRVCCEFPIGEGKGSARLLSSPVAVPDDRPGSRGNRIYFGAEQRSGVKTVGVVYCLRDAFPANE